jgi:hypothetical protein
VGTAYSYTFTASGDPAPTYSVASGTLPTGLGLDSTTGVLSGTTSAPGTFSFTVQAVNGVSPPAPSPTLTITVAVTVAPTKTAEDNFARPDQSGWSTTTNNDALPNYAWQRSLAAGQPYSDIASHTGIITYTGTPGHKAQGYVNVPSNNGGDILADVVFSATGHQLAGVTLSTNPNGAAWYQCDLNTQTGVVNLVKRLNGVMNWVAQVPFVAQPGTPYWLRCDVQPNGTTNVVSARVWAAGNPEPTTWQVTWTDPSPLAAGQAGAMGDWPTRPAAGEQIQFLNWAYAAAGFAAPAS